MSQSGNEILQHGEKKQVNTKLLNEDLRPIIRETATVFEIICPILAKYQFVVEFHPEIMNAFVFHYKSRVTYLEMLRKFSEVTFLPTEIVFSIEIPLKYNARRQEKVEQIIEKPKFTEEETKLFGELPPFVKLSFPLQEQVEITSFSL